LFKLDDPYCFRKCKSQDILFEVRASAYGRQVRERNARRSILPGVSLLLREMCGGLMWRHGRLHDRENLMLRSCSPTR
jgi:hypothetical protein